MANTTNARTGEKSGVRATVRYLHTSPYKVRQVLTLVRGLPVDDAERLLQLCEKDAADDVLKLLGSAIANAEHNNSIPADELYVALAWADEGPTRKHGQPRARGRYFRIRKRTSHVTIVLERFAMDELETRRRREEATGRGAAVAQRRRAERVRRSRATEPEAVEADEPELEVEEVAQAPEFVETAPEPETTELETSEAETGDAAVGEVTETEASADEPEAEKD
jgi:large subunit ribosomal protein L22